jgi:hypothetical protein
VPDSGESPGLEVIQVQYGERVTQQSVVLYDYQQYDQPEVIPGHDGRVRDTHPALDGPARHIATVLG